ncbi:hypothetical protein NPIL_75811 [Nephila pilipes]|uniref:Uncharacterized protein n=1 Tax=Nephila pilipes TaxID=299642 RepID=A0A8X6PTD8_NEPPI|nr:hypothetical protein NPIL_75811 [Nephila pilipes]
MASLTTKHSETTHCSPESLTWSTVTRDQSLQVDIDEASENVFLRSSHSLNVSVYPNLESNAAEVWKSRGLLENEFTRTPEAAFTNLPQHQPENCRSLMAEASETIIAGLKRAFSSSQKRDRKPPKFGRAGASENDEHRMKIYKPPSTQNRKLSKFGRAEAPREPRSKPESLRSPLNARSKADA